MVDNLLGETKPLGWYAWNASPQDVKVIICFGGGAENHARGNAVNTQPLPCPLDCQGATQVFNTCPGCSFKNDALFSMLESSINKLGQ